MYSFSRWGSRSTENTSEIGFDIDNFFVEAHGDVIIAEIFPARVALLADYLPKFFAFNGTRRFIFAFTIACPGPCHAS
jgi:hypothetical protein